MTCFKTLLIFLITVPLLISCNAMGEPTTSSSSPVLPLHITIKNDDNKSELDYTIETINIAVVLDSREDNATMTATTVATQSGKVPRKGFWGVKGQTDFAVNLSSNNSYEDIDNGTYQIFTSNVASFRLTLSMGGIAAPAYIGHPQALGLGFVGKVFGLFYVTIPNSPALKGISDFNINVNSSKCGYGQSAFKGQPVNAFHLVLDFTNSETIKWTMGERTSPVNVYWDSKLGACVQGVYQPAIQ